MYLEKEEKVLGCLKRGFIGDLCNTPEIYEQDVSEIEDCENIGDLYEVLIEQQQGNIEIFESSMRFIIEEFL